MIQLSNGLKNSLIILEHLRDMEDLDGIHISVGTFTNCREGGLTFMVDNKDYESFTFCIYEHRNSDEIIINGKEGHITMNGQLPYKADNKWTVLDCFKWNQHYECAEKLSKLIIDFSNTKKESKC